MGVTAMYSTMASKYTGSASARTSKSRKDYIDVPGTGKAPLICAVQII